MKELVYPRLLLTAVERHADRVGFVDGGYRATFAQHLDRTARAADALSSLGVGPQDRFAVLAGNGHEVHELWHAALLGGGIINALNTRYSRAELAHALADSGARVAFADASFASAIDAVRPATAVEHVVLLGDGDVPHDARYEDLLAAATPRLPPEPNEDDAAVLMYTGGTTGAPKGAVIDQRAEVLNLYHVTLSWGDLSGHVNLVQTPMFHAATLSPLLAIPVAGSVTTYLRSFSPEAAMDAVEEHGVTFTVMVPTMIAMLLRSPAFRPERLSTLRTLTYGASPMPAPVLDHLLASCPWIDLFQGYGMTEAAAVLTRLDPSDHRAGGPRLRSAGRAVAGVALSIRGPDGDERPPGEVGEVCARAGNLMRGYWNLPDATAAAFDGGWYHTGDLGYLDDGGYLFLVDRAKDVIITGGENVYCREVEDAVASHPAVAQVAVIGLPDEVWGERVHAVVVRQEGASVTEEEIRTHARRSIAGYKVPKTVELRDDPLPLSAAMKVLKRELRSGHTDPSTAREA